GGGALVPVRVPIGDIEDIAAIDADRALAGDTAAFDALARRYNAADTLVAEATMDSSDAGGEAVVRLKASRYGPAGLMSTFEDEVRGSADDIPALLARAVDALDAQLEASWKSQQIPTVGSGTGNRLPVSAAIASLEQWLEIQRRLQQVTTVRRIELDYIARTEAKFDLVYDGDQLGLERALAGRGLQLAGSGGQWTLTLAGGYAPATAVPEPVTVPADPASGVPGEPVTPQPWRTGSVRRCCRWFPTSSPSRGCSRCRCWCGSSSMRGFSRHSGCSWQPR